MIWDPSHRDLGGWTHQRCHHSRRAAYGHCCRNTWLTVANLWCPPPSYDPAERCDAESATGSLTPKGGLNG